MKNPLYIDLDFLDFMYYYFLKIKKISKIVYKSYEFQIVLIFF